jgi:hypothetical protein
MAPKNNILMSAATRRRASKRMSWMPPSEAKTQRSSKSRHGLWTGAHPGSCRHADVKSDWFGEIELIEEPKNGVNPITLVPIPMPVCRPPAQSDDASTSARSARYIDAPCRRSSPRPPSSCCRRCRAGTPRQRQVPQRDRLVAPVELVGFPRSEAHRHIGMNRDSGPLIAPSFDEPMHAVVRAAWLPAQ